MEKELYIALKKEINKKLPKIKTVGLFNNQFESENKENAFLYPCVFIQFQPNDFKDLSMGVQQFEMTITAHLGFESYKDEDVEILEIKQELYKVMQRFQDGYFSMMTRVAERPNYNHDNIHVYETDYKVTGKDFTADTRNTKEKSLTPVVTTSVVNLNDL